MYKELKERHRQERKNQPDALSLRIHRALSWLHRAEQCEDADGQFIFNWIAFNAAYANDLENSIAESEMFSLFLQKLVDLDTEKRLHQIVWQQYTGAIRVLLDNHYVYQPFWNHLNGKSGADTWQESFKKSTQAAHRALANNDTGKVLAIVFSRLYTLRNQLMHGGATWNSSTNRAQIRDAMKIINDVVPAIIEIMMDNPNTLWGDAYYPVVE